jgi:DNA-binding CsgD family transcriptional regulator
MRPSRRHGTLATATNSVRWSVWMQVAAELVEQVDTPAFPRTMMNGLRTLVPCDVPSMILEYQSGSSPSVIHENDVPEHVIREVDDYLAGPYLLDPYYHAALAGAPSGVYRLRDIAPAGFRQSEFYRGYWRNTGIHDEIEFLVRLAPSRFAMVGLFRKDMDPFRRADMQFLTSCAPLLGALIVRHWAQTDFRPRRSEAASSSHLEKAFATFGAGALTLRETQVVRLLLRGHSTKSAAHALSVSPETVKLHRKHIYRKLGVGSHVELFHSFIAAIEQASELPQEPRS